MPFDPTNPHPDIDPSEPARCPRRLLGDGPACRALVLVMDAAEHARWHDALDDALQAPATVGGLNVAAWPEDDDDDAPTPTGGRPGL